MPDVIPISEAKASLSRLVKRASAGEVIYLGAYGRPDAILAPVPPRPQFRLGVWQEYRDAAFDHDSEELVRPDADLTASVERAMNAPLP